eukprot:scaffold85714_cov32-Tisochrysis_lutea.AAC.1
MAVHLGTIDAQVDAVGQGGPSGLASSAVEALRVLWPGAQRVEFGVGLPVGSACCGNSLGRAAG